MDAQQQICFKQKSERIFLFFSLILTYSRWTSHYHPACGDLRIFPSLPRFTPYDFFSRCKFSTLATRQPMDEFYLLTFPRFPLRKKKQKSHFGKNRTHDFRTSRCAAYLLDHSTGSKPCEHPPRQGKTHTHTHTHTEKENDDVARFLFIFAFAERSSGLLNNSNNDLYLRIGSARTKCDLARSRAKS